MQISLKFNESKSHNNDTDYTKSTLLPEMKRIKVHQTWKCYIQSERTNLVEVIVEMYKYKRNDTKLNLSQCFSMRCIWTESIWFPTTTAMCSKSSININSQSMKYFQVMSFSNLPQSIIYLKKSQCVVKVTHRDHSGFPSNYFGL